MSDNDKIEIKEKTSFFDVFLERPILSIFMIIFAVYLFWYLTGGPTRVELKTGISGWPVVFKYLFGF